MDRFRVERRDGVAHVLVLLPLAALVAWWALDEGGYAPVDWQPGAVLVLLLAALVVATPVLRASRRPTRRGLVALAAFGLYTAWSYASIGWAGSPGAALEGAHRCLLFLGVMVVLCGAAPPAAVLRGAAVAVAGISGLAALVTLVRIGGAAGPTGLFLDGRLLAPLGYMNADAAFWTTGALLAAVVASQRRTWAPLRPPLLALAAVEVGLATMTSSRGWLFTLPVVLVLVLVLVPHRLRFCLAVAAVGVAVLTALDAVLEPLRAGGGKSLEDGGAATVAAAQDAVGPLLLAGLVALVLGVVWVLADRRVVLSPGGMRRVGRAAGVLAAVLVAGGAAAAVVTVSAPVERLDRAWEDFKTNEVSDQSGSGRFSATGSTRYDFWRVAVDLTERRPVRGVGQDNFAQPYLARRGVENEEPRWVHSLPLRALAHTGVVGALLLLVALTALAAGALRLRGRPDDRGAAALALVPLVPWTVHGSVDWLWEFPVLSVVALGLAAGAASAPVVVRGEGEERPRPTWFPRAAAALVVVPAVVGALALAVAYVANRDVAVASEGWPADPAGAFERLDQARSLTPAARPLVVEGVIASRLGDLPRARRAFAAAARREPDDWFAPFQLGVLAAEAGDLRAAGRLFRDAARRNPKEPVIRAAREATARRRPFTRAEAERVLRERAVRRFGDG